MKFWQKILAGVLLSVGTIVFIGGFYLYIRYLTIKSGEIPGIIRFLIAISVLGIATLFAFLRLGWKIGDYWDKWINVWIGIFEFVLCGFLGLIGWSGLIFNSINTIFAPFIHIVLWLALGIGAIYQVGLADKISSKIVKYFVLFIEGIIGFFSILILIYLLILGVCLILRR